MAKAKKAAAQRRARTESLSFRLPVSVISQLDAVAQIAGTDRAMVIRVVMGLAIHQGRQLRLGAGS